MFNRTASVVFLALLAFLIPSYWVEVTYVDPEIEELRASVEALEPELNSTLYTYFRWAFPSSYRYIAPYEQDPYLGYVFPLWQKLRWASRERRRLQELSHSVRRMYGCLRGIRDGVVFCIVLAVCENLYLYFQRPLVEQIQRIIDNAKEGEEATTDVIPLILKIFFPVGLIGCLIVLGGALAEFFYLRPNMHKLTQTLHALQPKLQSSTYTLLRWMRPSDFPRIDLRSLHLDEQCKYSTLQRSVERATAAVKNMETIRSQVLTLCVRCLGTFLFLQVFCLCVLSKRLCPVKAESEKRPLRQTRQD